MIFEGPELVQRIAQLTERERLYLRLVHRHMTPKAIARELDVSPTSVDERIETAMRRLGVRSRREAAILLPQHEADRPPTNSGVPSSGVGEGSAGAETDWVFKDSARKRSTEQHSASSGPRPGRGGGGAVPETGPESSAGPDTRSGARRLGSAGNVVARSRQVTGG